jgi:phage-related protein
MEERLTAVVGARISAFKKKMAEVRRIMKTTPTKAEAEIDADTKGFFAKIKAVKASLADLNKSKVVIKIRDNFKQTQNRLDRISQTIHTLTNVGGNMFFGGLLAMSPGAIPLIAGAIASMAMLGPMIGVLAGSMFSLASAFLLAGAGAVAFGALAIPTISKVFEEGGKLNAQQKKAKKAFEGMKDTYKGIVKELEKPVLEAFTKSMDIVSRMLTMMKPTFEGAANAVNSLMDSLKASLGTPPVKAFFDYMNKTAGPMLELTGKAIGNFFKGLGSMMVAFAPLTDSVANGFLNMSQRFAEWADGLSKSEKFQSFVSYVQENMPKVRTIFRDAIAGITYFFTAFGPLAADMMTGLADLMGRFKDWAKTLDKNPAFQNFIKYIRENGPAMLTFISEMSRLVTNLASSLAPLGARILELTNKFLNWFNGIIEKYPIVGKLVGVFIVLAGLFQAFVPVITVAITMFSGFGGVLMRLLPLLGGIFSTFKLNLIVGLRMIGAQALKQGARMAAGFLIGMGPVGWVIATVIALVALIIWKWDEIVAFTKKYWTMAWELIKAAWGWIVTTVTTKAVEMIAKAKSKFEEMKNAIKEKMDAAKETVSDILDAIKGVFDGINLYDSGKKIIQSAIDGILAMSGSVGRAVSTIAGKIRDFFPFSPAKEGPLSTLHRLDFGGPVSDSIMRAKSEIQSAMGSMLAVPDYGIGAELATTHSMKVSAPKEYERKGDNQIVEQIKLAFGEMVIDNKIVINERELIEATGKPMMQYMDKETKKAGRKGGYQR